MNELLVQVVVVAVVANVLLLLVALIVSRFRGREPVQAALPQAYATAAVASGPAPLPPGDAELAAATEGMGSPAMAMDDRPTSLQASLDATASEPPLPAAPAQPAAQPETAASPAAGPEPGPDLIDPETGLPTEPAWEDVLRHEEARLARYGRPATILVVELDRLDSLAERLGRENADRLIAPVARALRRQARAADQVMRTGHARFSVLLPETDEIQAINYAERVRDACDAWLDASAVSVRLAMGWASAAAGTSLREAAGVAERRMHADRLRIAPRPAPPRQWPTTAPGASRPEVVPPVERG